ncbi:MAG: peroxiredoxin [Candidatus Auribacterota bacterium]
MKRWCAGIICLLVLNCLPPVYAEQNATVGKPAPAFSGTAVYADGLQKLSLEDYKGKWLVLFFFPMAFSGVCLSEVAAFSQQIDDFHQIDAEVVGVSVDSHLSLLAWTKQMRGQTDAGEITYPLLSDISKSIASEYGVLLPSGIALRAVFVIDPDQCIRYMSINDIPIGHNIDDVVRTIKALQHFEKHGHGCPANWRPGDKAIILDPSKPREYFRAANQIL